MVYVNLFFIELINCIDRSTGKTFQYTFGPYAYLTDATNIIKFTSRIVSAKLLVYRRKIFTK